MPEFFCERKSTPMTQENTFSLKYKRMFVFPIAEPKSIENVETLLARGVDFMWDQPRTSGTDTLWSLVSWCLPKMQPPVCVGAGPERKCSRPSLWGPVQNMLNTFSVIRPQRLAFGDGEEELRAPPTASRPHLHHPLRCKFRDFLLPKRENKSCHEVALSFSPQAWRRTRLRTTACRTATPTSRRLWRPRSRTWGRTRMRPWAKT